MLAVLEMIDRENAMIEARGVRKGKLETAKKMLEENIPMQVIIKVTGLTGKQIMKLNTNKK